MPIPPATPRKHFHLVVVRWWCGYAFLEMQVLVQCSLNGPRYLGDNLVTIVVPHFENHDLVPSNARSGGFPTAKYNHYYSSAGMKR